MRVLSLQLSVLSVCGWAMLTSAEEPPLPFPDLPHYKALWERSIFTSRDLPSPDGPAGPIFTDSLSLTGVYEVDGAVVAVLVDRTTSLITEARLGAENEAGIKIRKITPGATMDKTRVQLQKGDQAGWVSFAEIPVTAVPSPAPAIQTRKAVPVPLNSPLLPPVQNSATSSTAPGDVPLPPP